MSFDVTFHVRFTIGLNEFYQNISGGNGFGTVSYLYAFPAYSSTKAIPAQHDDDLWWCLNE